MIKPMAYFDLSNNIIIYVKQYLFHWIKTTFESKNI